jgi:enamine deaminase RidA (YjgF/YER057c/UK114 family)
MPRRVNPGRIAPPASRYSHGILHSARARRLVVSGQVGLRFDGTVAATLEEQLDTAFDNVFAVVREAGMGVADIIKIVTYVTQPGSVQVYRRVRDLKFGGHAPAATYLEVSGLADAQFLCEVEAEAVSEDPDVLFEDTLEQVATLPPGMRPPR